MALNLSQLSNLNEVDSILIMLDLPLWEFGANFPS